MNTQVLIERLSGCGVRPTQQRIAVYQYLVENRNHPSADTIYRELSGVFPVFSRTTIYNTLNTLLQAGLVRLVSITPDEQRFDADTSDHGHFLCGECGAITDFEVEAAAVRDLCPEGFDYRQGDVFIRGSCPVCRASENEATA